MYTKISKNYNENNRTSNIKDGEKIIHIILMSNFDANVGTSNENFFSVGQFEIEKKIERWNVSEIPRQIKNDNYKYIF